MIQNVISRVSETNQKMPKPYKKLVVMVSTSSSVAGLKGNGFSPECVLKCVFKLQASEKVLGH